MEVLVFSTSVASKDQVRELTPLLNSFAGKGRWNFALDDDDHVLRIISSDIHAQAAIRLMNELGYRCEELEDFIPL